VGDENHAADDWLTNGCTADWLQRWRVSASRWAGRYLAKQLQLEWRHSMRRIRKPVLLTSLALCAAITFAYAGTPERSAKSNSYYLYTKALTTTESGVVAVPSRFKWSIETSWSGIDAQGKDLPDTRVMMRLYDPDQNFTALTAQMDLETAEKLQRELGDIIAKKRQNADYQYRPQLYDSSLIPTGRITGIDNNGEAIIELEPREAK